jgi:hypothetical protein
VGGTCQGTSLALIPLKYDVFLGKLTEHIMKKITLLFVLFTAISDLAFTLTPSTNNTSKAGVYGDCDGVIKIQLTINQDFTFSYFNGIDPNKKIEATGEWTQEGNKIVLTNYSSNHPIDESWKMDNAFPCLKSRTGMNYLRICSCNK